MYSCINHRAIDVITLFQEKTRSIHTLLCVADKRDSKNSHPYSFMKKTFVFIAGLFLGSILLTNPASAQEFNCRVSVNIQQLSGSEFTFLKELEEQMSIYINERSFTEDRYEEHERIDCIIQIIFEESVSLTSFAARIVLSTARPIYGTPSLTTILQLSDESWQFNYAQGTPLVFDLERFDPLTSVLDFYVYIMLGYDYDTFAELGGSPYFERARRIAELAETQGAVGWSDLGSDRGRSSLVDQVLDPRFRPLREAYFKYHFSGLDVFVSEIELARENALEALRGLRDLYDDISREYVMDIFFATKAEELAAIFEDSPLSSEAYELLSQIDPANLSKYDKLVN